MTWSNTLINFINNKKILLGLGFALLGFYFLPYFLYGKDIYISVYDNLDSNVVWFKVLAHSGKIFADSMEIIPNMMGGLPRLSYDSEFNVILWLYYFFDDFTAYVINDIFIHTFAFMSMFVLLSNYFIDDKTPNKNFIVFTAAILFAMIPFWPSGGLSVAGQPLVLWAFLNIRKHQFGKREWIVLALIPFYSSLILSMMFVLAMVTVIFVYDTFKTKKINVVFLAAIAFMSIVFLIVEYRLVLMLFQTGYISHRVEFVRPTYPIETSLLQLMPVRFLEGYKNTLPLQYTYIVPFLIFVLITTLLPKSDKKIYTLIGISLFMGTYITQVWMYVFPNDFFIPVLIVSLILLTIFKKEYKTLYLLILLEVFLAISSEIWFSDIMKSLTTSFPFLEQLNFSRTVYLMPMFWYITLAYAFMVLSKKYKLIPLVIFVLLVLQMATAFKARFFVKADKAHLSYKTFYASEQFDLIKKDIGKDPSTYKVGSIGIYPTIAVYNGLYTVDGYSANYPLSYKHTFSKILSDDLKKEKSFQRLFTNWGSKCYLFSEGETYAYYKKESVFSNLDFNMEVLDSLDVSYYISANPISDSDKMGVTLINSYLGTKWFWDLYLYKRNTSASPKNKSYKLVDRLQE